MTYDPTANMDQLKLPPGVEGFDFMERLATAIAIQYRNAGIEYRKKTGQAQLYLDRAARLAWIQRMYHGKLPHEPGDPQPVPLGGDHHGDAA